MKDEPKPMIGGTCNMLSMTNDIDDGASRWDRQMK